MRFLLSLLIACVIGSLHANEKPNVLMISVDDLNDWIGCLGGHPDAITPHLDSLAARGVNFTNAHCSVTVCSPSRISVISGVGPTTHGSYELGTPYQEIARLDDVPTMPGFFKANGYTTITGGKILHHNFTGRLEADNNLVLTLRKGGPNPKKTFHAPKPWDWGAFPKTDAEMYDYQLAGAAAETLRQEHDKPFFLSVGLFRPHVPMFVPPHWYELYDAEAITMPDADPTDMDDIPGNFQYKMWIAPTLAELQDRKHWRSMVHAYLANTSFVDHCVGEIIKGLDSGPNKDNTIIVLWSDHGFHIGEKQHIAKRTLWEESTRVPLFFAGPGIEPGTSPEPASLLDIFPTLIELTDLPENKHLEGISLTPQLNNPSTPRERPALSSSYFGNHSVRTRDWRYIRYDDGAEELYDHRVDPDEKTNLADKAEYTDLKKKLAAHIPVGAAPEVKTFETREQVRTGKVSRP
ncbi:MAG: sulfatase [Verrucomicrobiales bacterium]|nr:sulfatase [Verrucomicrobiales bacterium]